MLGRLERVVEGALAAAGWWRAPPAICRDVERLAAAMQPPQGPALSAAESLLDRTAPAWLAAHCRRTWAWSAALGEATGVACDRELLYLAALFHDLGLTQAHRPAPGDCFAVTGARAASAWALSAGLGEPKASVIEAAIALHLEVRVALAEGPEAHLLQQGAACDVLGARLQLLPSEVVTKVLQRYPRGEQHDALPAEMRKHAAHAPASRMGLYCRHFHFAERAARAASRRPA